MDCGQNGHTNKNVAKAQIKAKDISRGTEMVKLKTNEATANEKAKPPLLAPLRSDASRNAGAAHSQHAAGRDRVARSAAGVSVSI